MQARCQIPVVALLAVLASMLATQAAHAADASTTPHLFGDWNGERPRLEAKGITFDLGYDSQVAHNFSGGTDELTRYADQWRFGATLDLDKLWNWKGASFKALMTDRHGRDVGLDAHIGNNQSVQDVYGRGQTLHLTVFALDENFFNGKVDWRIGRLPVGVDFASFSCDFQNLTFCGAQPGNIVGDYWINTPTSQWATRVKFDTSHDTYVQIGAYQVNPIYIDDGYARRNGWKLDFPSGTTGVLVPFEFGWKPSINGLPGSYKIGGWHNSSPGADLFLDINGQPRAITGAEALQHDSRRGGYMVAKQQVTGEANTSGLTVFLRAVQADRATSATDRQLAVGIEYQGPFGRSDDTVGLAIGTTRANGYAADYQRLYNQVHADQVIVQDGSETAIALFYGFTPIPGLTLRPNLQYIRRPGGAAANSNALVLGLDTSITF